MDRLILYGIVESRLRSRLSDNPPTYWELEIHAKTPGVDYKASFLVPVYAKDEPDGNDGIEPGDREEQGGDGLEIK